MGQPPTTRLAPSPTGALHLGNARTFLANWALARQRGWRVLLRLEDLDGPRIKPGAAELAIDTLAWLGIDWDGEPVFQSHDLAPYRSALERLGGAGLAYPCHATRSQLAAAALSAPHATDHEIRYPGTHRPPTPEPISYEPIEGAAWRVRAPDREIAFDDAFAGPISHNVQASVGDFVVATKAGLPSYQLAVVVDDHRQGVTDVVRGDDLLLSTPRQLLLQELLGLAPPPRYCHLPMVIGEDGRRLAKRHGDTRVDAYRRLGAPAAAVRGLLAEWCGMGPRRLIGPSEFVERFDLAAMPREPIVFRKHDDAWLRDQAGEAGK